jgi:hypothetical protein
MKTCARCKKPITFDARIRRWVTPRHGTRLAWKCGTGLRYTMHVPAKVENDRADQADRDVPPSS